MTNLQPYLNYLKQQREALPQQGASLEALDRAIALTEQVVAGQIEVTAWLAALRSLQVDQPPEEAAPTYQADIAGSGVIAQGDKARAVSASMGGVAVGGNVGTIDVRSEAPLSPEEKLARRNRTNMLALVENTWIKGVLEKSIHGAAMLALELVEEAEAVKRPWDSVLRVPGQKDQPLPLDMELTQIFDEANETLLILGQPGSGKTIMLLDLCCSLIGRALEDDNQPIPVVFNLSTWSETYKTLDEWLVAELKSKYNVTKTVAEPWLKQSALCLLLDGLDEVAADQREACVQAINACRKSHDFLKLAVCSRTTDYENLSTKLELDQAISIRPLSADQIDAYLNGAGPELQAVRRTLQTDPALQELVRTPLLLSILVLAYKGRVMDTLTDLTTLEAQREHIFSVYVQTALNRRGEVVPFTDQQTCHYLIWLAHQMQQDSRTSFMIEDLQPAWLTTQREKWQYHLILRGIVGLIFLGVESSLVLLAFAFIAAIDQTPIHWLSYIFSLTAGLAAGATFILSSLVTTRLRGIFFILAILGSGLVLLQWFPIITVFLAGILFGLPSLLIGMKLARASEIDLMLLRRWSWQRGKSGLLIGLLIGLLVAILVPDNRVINSLQAGIPIAIIFTLLLGLEPVEELPQQIWPGQGLRRSVARAIRAGALVFTTIFSLIIFTSIADDSLSNGLALGLTIATPIGLAASLGFGGLSALQHGSLRLILYKQGYVSWSMTKFLDFATDLVLLQRVGGGYMFIHRLLLEHFAHVDIDYH